MVTSRPNIYINPSDGTSVLSTGYSYFRDAREWGSGLVGASDGWQILQTAIDDCIANGYRKLFIPAGCKISKPLFASKTYNGLYTSFTLEIFGDKTMWDADNTPSIIAEFNDTFILGVQHGKGCNIKGLWLQGQFTPPSGTDRQYFNRSFADFTDGSSRDSYNSPYTAIAIDPVSNGQIPSDGGYPGMSTYYKGNNSQAGSTAITIKDCIIEKVVVGIGYSVNGYTRNAEITSVDSVQFKFNKLCISGGQDQEKANTVRRIACWYDSHTIFATGKYGSGGMGNWDIDTVNIAGRVVRFIENGEQGYFPSTIKNVYAERLGTWGTISNNGAISAKVEDCRISFTTPDETGLLSPLIDGSGAVYYEKCDFRYYGFPGAPLPIAGDMTFEKCSFSGFPLFVGNYFYPRFINCRANNAHLGLAGIKTFSSGTYHQYGNYTLDNYIDVSSLLAGNTYGLHNQINFKSQDIYTSYIADAAVAVTVGANYTATFTSADGSGYGINFLVNIIGYLGLVTGVSGNNITVAYLPSTMASGTYGITVFRPVYFTPPMVGDIISGTNTISNTRIHPYWGGSSLSILIGQAIRNPYGGSKYLIITQASGTTLTFYGSVTTTKTGAIFGNYGSQEVYTDYPTNSAFPGDFVVRRGDRVIEQKGSENSIEHIVTKGGFLSGSDIRQAQLQIAY